MATADPVSELSTDRLVLRSITTADVVAVVAGQRLPGWAADFPSPGDREIAGLLSRTGVPTGADRAFGHRLVVERETGEVVGGVGFFGPPHNGRLEVGYGIVPSRRRRGYATEAVAAMLEYGFAQPAVAEVIATTELDNAASIGVLVKSGLRPLSRDGSQVTYLVTG